MKKWNRYWGLEYHQTVNDRSKIIEEEYKEFITELKDYIDSKYSWARLIENNEEIYERTIEEAGDLLAAVIGTFFWARLPLNKIFGVIADKLEDRMKNGYCLKNSITAETKIGTHYNKVYKLLNERKENDNGWYLFRRPKYIPDPLLSLLDERDCK